MALSKKHFEFIAADIRSELGALDALTHPTFTGEQCAAARTTLRNLAGTLCVTFRAENPNFDGQRFLKACGF